MGRGRNVKVDDDLPVEHRSPGSRELLTCNGGPGGSELHCDGFEHHVVELVPECCGNFLETGECCGNAVPGEELVPVEPCPHAAANARYRPRLDSGDEPF